MDMTDSLIVGDKLVIKTKENLPAVVDESIKTLETELVIEEIQPTYITMSYKTSKEYAEEHEGTNETKISFLRSNIKEFFKKKSK